MNLDRTIGYLLLLLGILTIIVSTFFVYQVFTGQKNPPQVFNLESPSFKLPSANISTPQLDLSQVNIPGLDLQELVPQENDEQDKTQEVKFIPDQLLNGIANISLFLLLMSFISSAGLKLASLGIKLIKTPPPLSPSTKNSLS
jgi:hypothetical protein